VRFIASSFGSAGDFLPTLAVAHALVAEGHDVLFATNPFHERAVRCAGFEFLAVGKHVDLYEMVREEPDLLSATGGGLRMVEELAAPYVASMYHATRELLRSDRADAVLGSNLCHGIFWAAMERRVPGIMIAPTPLFWLAGHAPEQFLDFQVPRSVLPHVTGLTRAVAVGLADHKLRSVAREVGATSFDASMTAIEPYVALHAGMWPELLRPRSPGDDANQQACGFARAGHLGTAAPALSREIEAFLAAGPAPVVIALGSVFSLGSDGLVADAAAACQEIGRRCLIVGRAPRDRELPEGTLVVPYATYHLLFSHAAAIVIHGGAGTTGEALRSGRPSVVVPFAFDQFGLAWQVDRLGTGVRVPKRGRNREALVRALRAACEDDGIAARASAVAAELGRLPDGAQVAARRAVEACSRRRR
jgi:UDP:flavonoid glycosyltransferase YjiC (YdhE family)